MTTTHEDTPSGPTQAMAWLITPLVNDLPVERFREIDDAWMEVVAHVRSLEARIAAASVALVAPTETLENGQVVISATVAQSLENYVVTGNPDNPLRSV